MLLSFYLEKLVGHAFSRSHSKERQLHKEIKISTGRQSRRFPFQSYKFMRQYHSLALPRSKIPLRNSYSTTHLRSPMSSSLVFSVRRRQPVLIKPAEPTPHEFKYLSDIDDQEGLRFQIPIIQFYRNNPAKEGKDPCNVIKEAIAKVLVFYYPLAGRLREGRGRKLIVECTGEGIVFIEADADVTLEQFGDALQPPFPCLEELIYDVPGSGGLLNCPLLLIQVTRLKCGGFIFGLRLNHTMCDAAGLVQFLTAVGEMAWGATRPTIVPVWQREVLSARDPPHVTYAHREYDQDADPKPTSIPVDDMAQQSFFFGPTEISALRKPLPPHLRSCSTVELITACIWRCRTIALRPDPDEEMRMICLVSCRYRFNFPLPAGYYGNTFALPVAISTAGKIFENPIGYALELLRKAKEEVNQEYMQSVADLMVMRGRPHFTVARTYVVSDVTRAGFREVDFGWGKAVYGGPTRGGVAVVPGLTGFYIPYKNSKGEDGVVVPICLPGPAMEIFIKELQAIITEPKDDPCTGSSKFIRSAM